MSTARTLLVAALDEARGQAVHSGDLSLALAGAELVDLLDSGAVTLREDRIVPGTGAGPADILLARAFATLRGAEPYEPVGDWLWRRGEGLTEAYVAALVAEGSLTRRRRRGRPFAGGVPVVAEGSPDARRAAERLASGDPVLATLVRELGPRNEPVPDPAEALGDPESLVLAAVGDALLELEGERQRRAVERAAFDNVWRGSD
ncbi:GPP34 family phosphoprotein [Streptomyces sp. NPDC048717]|uniref:GPP34 family phosphoprotein n=1 Tax=Streptomyces sp. NPDC048717 TaxID=3154928 RepID=UPI00342BFF58